MVATSRSRPDSGSGGPEHFARMASDMGTPAIAAGAWDDLHVQTLLLRPGGWSHPGTNYLRLTVPLSRDGRVRRRLPGESKDWIAAVKRRGTVSVTPPGTEGDWEWLDQSHFGLIFIPQRLLRQALDDEGANSTMLSLRPAYAEQDALIGPVFDAIQNEIGRAGRGSRLLVSSAALFLTRYVLATYGRSRARGGTSTNPLDNACLRRVVAAIDARLEHDWSVPEMAREAGLSPFWFAHVFKDKLGVSPRRFVQQRRLRCARRLLERSSGSIAEIAAHCGFESQSWFTTTFKQEFGITPGAYRQTFR